MSQFLSNLPPPLRFKFSRCLGAALGRQPLVPPSAVVPALLLLSHSPDGAGSLTPIPSHGHSVNEDVVPHAESLEPNTRMVKGKQHAKEGFQRKKKWVVSVESDEFVPEGGLMADARRIGREEEFFIINPSANPNGRLLDVADHCR